MNALHKLENEVMQFVCVENLAYNLKTQSDSKPQTMFSVDRLEVKGARYITHIMSFFDF